eukprot:PhF_6_TR36261/c0_g1_i1/m.52893
MESKSSSLRILFYNMQILMPGIAANGIFNSYKDQRIDVFCSDVLPQYDVVCLCEVWETRGSWLPFKTLQRRKTLIHKAKQLGFTYTAESPAIPWMSLSIADGGLLVLSKVPITAAHSYTFTTSASMERMVQNGYIHVTLQPPGGAPTLHVAVTHLQSDHVGWNRIDGYATTTRTKQLQQLKSHLDREVPSHEAIYVVGDFNVNARDPKHRKEYVDMLKLMNAKDVVYDITGEHCVTLGAITPAGQPTETMLTCKDDQRSQQCVDYILEMKCEGGSSPLKDGPRWKVVQANCDPLRSAKVPCGQLSDHHA